MRLRTLTVVIAAVALSATACKKKQNDKPAPAAGTAAGTASGTAAGTGSGTAAGTGAGTATAGSGDPAGSGSAAATGVDPGMSNKAGNCPAAVAGAKAELVEDATLKNAIALAITATDPDAVATVRKRAAHLVAVQAAPDADVKHSGEGTGGGAGMCPVITAKDVTIASSEIEGGVKVVMTSTGAMTAADLAKEVVTRIDKMTAFRPATAPADGEAGKGAGAGGGQGDHGGNHSGEGDGHGKEREAAQGGPAQ